MRRIAFVLGVLLAWTTSAVGQDYTLRVPDVDGLKESTVTTRVLLDNAGGEIQGWSFGLCFDPAFVTLEGTSLGATTEVVNLGSPPDFSSIGTYPDGINMFVVVCYMGCATLGAGTDYEILTADFTVETLYGTSSSLSFCETVGDPPAENLLVVGDAGAVPTLIDGTIASVVAGITFGVVDSAAGYNPADGLGVFDVPVEIVEADTSPGYPNDIEGFSMAFGFDPNLLISTGGQVGPDLALIDGGSGPDFFAPVIGPDAFTLGVVFAFLGGVFMQADGPKHIADAQFETNTATLIGDLVGATTDLVWESGIGPVSTDNVCVIMGESFPPSYDDGVVTLVPVPPIDPLTCETQPSGVDIELNWVNGAVYDEIELRRDGVLIETLGGTVDTYFDSGLPAGLHTYDLTPKILGASGNVTSCSAPSAPPLTGLNCSLDGQDVQLGWDAPAPGYDSIRVLRDGVEIQSISGDAESAVDLEPGAGTYEYSIVGDVAGLLSDPTSCTIEVLDQPGFIRGDGNADGQVDIADPVYNLSYLFQSGPQQCLDAQDSNDDGAVDIADPIYNLSYLFQSGPTPPAPFPDCGPDPTDDAVECGSHPPCE